MFVFSFYFASLNSLGKFHFFFFYFLCPCVWSNLFTSFGCQIYQNVFNCFRFVNLTELNGFLFVSKIFYFSFSLSIFEPPNSIRHNTGVSGNFFLPFLFCFCLVSNRFLCRNWCRWLFRQKCVLSLKSFARLLQSLYLIDTHTWNTREKKPPRFTMIIIIIIGTHCSYSESQLCWP